MASQLEGRINEKLIEKIQAIIIVVMLIDTT